MGTEHTPLEARLLLLPPTRRDADAIGKLLGGAAIEYATCASVNSLCAELQAGAAAIVVSEESLISDDRVLADCLASQPVWSDLPIIVLSRTGAELASLGRIVKSL